MNKRAMTGRGFRGLVLVFLLAVALFVLIQLFGRVAEPSGSVGLKYIIHCLNRTSVSERDDCVTVAALQNSFPDLCRNVSSDGVGVCYSLLAERKMNSSYCGLIQDDLVSPACGRRVEFLLENPNVRVLDTRLGFSADGLLVVNFTAMGLGDLQVITSLGSPVELTVGGPVSGDDLQVLSLSCGGRKVFDTGVDDRAGFVLVNIPIVDSQSYGRSLLKTLVVEDYSCGSTSSLSFRVLSPSDVLRHYLAITVFMEGGAGGNVL